MEGYSPSLAAQRGHPLLNLPFLADIEQWLSRGFIMSHPFIPWHTAWKILMASIPTQIRDKFLWAIVTLVQLQQSVPPMITVEHKKGTLRSKKFYGHMSGILGFLAHFSEQIWFAKHLQEISQNVSGQIRINRIPSRTVKRASYLEFYLNQSSRPEFSVCLRVGRGVACFKLEQKIP